MARQKISHAIRYRKQANESEVEDERPSREAAAKTSLSLPNPGAETTSMMMTQASSNGVESNLQAATPMVAPPQYHGSAFSPASAQSHQMLQQAQQQLMQQQVQQHLQQHLQHHAQQQHLQHHAQKQQQYLVPQEQQQQSQFSQKNQGDIFSDEELDSVGVRMGWRPSTGGVLAAVQPALQVVPPAAPNATQQQQQQQQFFQQQQQQLLQAFLHAANAVASQAAAAAAQNSNDMSAPQQQPGSINMSYTSFSAQASGPAAGTPFQFNSQATTNASTNTNDDEQSLGSDVEEFLLANFNHKDM